MVVVNIVVVVVVVVVIYLFDLILNVPSTIFQLYWDGYSWVEPVLSYRINVSCSRTTM